MPKTAARAPLTKERWKALHEEAFALWKKLEEAGAEGADALAAEGKRYDALAEEYRRGVPQVAIARCPHCEEEVRHSLDVLGLSGLWWRYHAPIRPAEKDVCKHFLVLTGAARTPKKVPFTPHLVKPGPEVPFVVPRLLELGGVTAVIRGVRVGGDPAWAISYFAKKPSKSWGLVNSWASEDSPRATANVSFREEADLGDTEYDYDLKPRIEAGQLAWIAEGDEALTLHREAKGCPYLGLKGLKEMVYLQEGERWSVDAG